MCVCVCIYFVFCFLYFELYVCVCSTSSFRTFSIKQTVFFFFRDDCFVVWVLSVCDAASQKGRERSKLVVRVFFLYFFLRFICVVDFFFFNFMQRKFSFQIRFQLEVSAHTNRSIYWERDTERQTAYVDLVARNRVRHYCRLWVLFVQLFLMFCSAVN